MKVKLLGLFTALLIVLSGCVTLSGSMVLAAAQSGDVAYTLLFDPFGSPTPTPSPTAEPTVTPTPTPRPEPTEKPTLDMYCLSTASVSNLKVNVTGSLTYNNTAIPNANIYLGYSADSGDTWQNFTFVQTRVDGSFGAVWIPNATGNYLMCAYWEGNWTLHWMNTTAALALAHDSAGNVFSVTSNSTVSGFTYNEDTQTVSLATNGTSSTLGYLQVSIPKTLLSDVETLEVNIDGKTIEFTSVSQDETWVISCLYSQSAHTFTMQIPFKQVLSANETPWIAIVLIIILVLIALAALVVVRRRRRTAATVAAILKENRPVN
ncbi:MAG: hypothetical protein NWE93_02460 [Candidatus Bathyarchaeota archaeon]|nr:hypothetical protein [Candidatus Bathyarchaeota archaeon]